MLYAVSISCSFDKLLLEMVSSAMAIEVLIPTPSSLSSLFSNVSRFSGSSERPRFVRYSNLVSDDA